jgi:hypothetical protein
VLRFGIDGKALEKLAYIAESFIYRIAAALCEDGLEVAFEEATGVSEVLFGVGFGGGDALKRFAKDPDNPLLFWERGDFANLRIDLIAIDARFYAFCQTG